MENNAVPTLTVFEKPSLQDQIVVAAAGTIATVVVTVALSAGATWVQSVISKKAAKKAAKLQTIPSTD